MRAIVIGAEGFVGSAFCRVLEAGGHDVVRVTRVSYAELTGTRGDLLVEAACNSRKFFAEEAPFEEFASSVVHRLETIRDFPADLHLHVSSVDVYPRLDSREATTEEATIGPGGSSFYGFHKWLAEQIVRHYCEDWLIVRLAGMVGPGLRKNPIYDILHDQPLRIHPDSRYQFMRTDDVAALTMRLLADGCRHEIFNVCGDGLVSPREIADMAGRRLDLSALRGTESPRIVDVSNAKLARRYAVPATRDAVAAFVHGRAAG